jgi:hypothetical protein
VGEPYPLAACEVATLCCSPPALESRHELTAVLCERKWLLRLPPREGRCLGWRTCPHAQPGSPPATVRQLHLLRRSSTQAQKLSELWEERAHRVSDQERLAMTCLEVRSPSPPSPRTGRTASQRSRLSTSPTVTDAGLTEQPPRGHVSRPRLLVVAVGAGLTEQTFLRSPSLTG